MSTYDDSCELVERAMKLPFRHAVAFGASCCERLALVYEAWAVTEGLDSGKVPDEALLLVWNDITLNNVPRHRLDQTIELLDEVAPDMDKTTSILSVPAKYAVIGISNLLACCINKNKEKLAGTVQCAYIAMQYYLSDVIQPADITLGDETMGFEDVIQELPIMRYEIQMQQLHLSWLENAPELTDQLIADLKHFGRKGGIDPFQRGIVPWRYAKDYVPRGRRE